MPIIDFIDVLKCFVIVLRRMGPDVWQGEGPEWAHVVFNSIKDNTRFSDVLCNLPAPVPKDDWQLKWIEVYANTTAKLPVFKDILPSVLQFLCEELQHDRFKAVRPNAMSIASRVGSLTLMRESYSKQLYSSYSPSFPLKARRVLRSKLWHSTSWRSTLLLSSMSHSVDRIPKNRGRMHGGRSEGY